MTASHGYVPYTRGCRCAVCKVAKANYMRARRARARENAARHTQGSDGSRPTRGTAWAPGATRYVAPISLHGTRAGYDEHGCRCEPCSTHAVGPGGWKRRRPDRRRAAS